MSRPRRRPLSAILAEAFVRAAAQDRLAPAVSTVLDQPHFRPCPECMRVQETTDLNHHAPGCRLGDALAALVAAMPEGE